MNQKEIQQKRYLNVKETASYLGISPGTIYNGTGRKAKKPFPVQPKRIGKSLRFDKLQLDEHMDSSC